ncbi:MAG: glycine cleavage system protein GcvH [Deltaproteobacteria bacterium]|nr:glycine cleavage system protein GcvH [Deltaproteobacteria bacterium]MBW2317937.1 glycine cleavage system protein GcvH [Deltaproteobacteria bacterium]OEU45091.1 MAG: glycine cleavage system protein H [Desulfobacterales bacterium S7086C20]
MLILDELCYSEEHIWVRREGDHTVTLGITDYAQSELGALSYVELPNEGDEIMPYESFGSIECSRIVTDLYAPLAGHVLEVNEDVIDDPAIINHSPYKEGWVIRAKLSSSDELDRLMSADDYEEYVLDGKL